MRLYIYIGAIVAIVGAIGGAYLYGWQAGERAIVSEILKSRAESVDEKREIDNEIDTLNRSELLDRANRFVRGDD